MKSFKVNIFGTANARSIVQHENEYNIVRKFQHENVIELLDILRIDDEIHLVFPVMENGLDVLIYDESYLFDRERTKKIMCMILSGLAHIHGKKVIHRDLKPENILIDCDGTAKISDFGLSTTNIPESTVCGTSSYRAPEMVMGYEYTQKVDVWVSQGLITTVLCIC